jgi:hypothetical protein
VCHLGPSPRAGRVLSGSIPADWTTDELELWQGDLSPHQLSLIRQGYSAQVVQPFWVVNSSLACRDQLFDLASHANTDVCDFEDLLLDQRQVLPDYPVSAGTNATVLLVEDWLYTPAPCC